MVGGKEAAKAVAHEGGALGADFKDDVHGLQIGGKEAVKAVAHEGGALGEDFKDDVHGLQMIRLGRSDEESADFEYDNEQDERHDTIFDMVGSALFSSVTIYLIADLREFVRSHPDEIQGDPELARKLLDPPVLDTDIVKLRRANRELFNPLVTEEGMYMEAIEKYGTEILKDLEVRKSSVICQHAVATRQPAEIVVIDDEMSQTELVYAIKVDKERRHFKVIFRGSVTVRDWITDASMSMKVIDNPLANDSSVSIPQSKKIGMHVGFYTYLFGTDKTKGSTSKYDQILAHLRSLLQKHPGFSIQVCGHSLGGALSSLCAFQLALEENITKPVIAISFASPKTGNICLCRAVQELELQHKILCLRVVNHNDLIPQIPDRLTWCTFFCQDAIFRHVGIKLILYDSTYWHPNRTHRFWFPRIRRSCIRQLLYDLKVSILHTVSAALKCLTCCFLGFNYMKWHGCRYGFARVPLGERFRIPGTSNSSFSFLSSSPHLPESTWIVSTGRKLFCNMYQSAIFSIPTSKISAHQAMHSLRTTTSQLTCRNESSRLQCVFIVEELYFYR